LLLLQLSKRVVVPLLILLHIKSVYRRKPDEAVQKDVIDVNVYDVLA